MLAAPQPIFAGVPRIPHTLGPTQGAQGSHWDWGIPSQAPVSNWAGGSSLPDTPVAGGLLLCPQTDPLQSQTKGREAPRSRGSAERGGGVSDPPMVPWGPQDSASPNGTAGAGGQQAPMVHGDPGARRAPMAWQEQGLSRMGGSVNPNGARGCRSSASPEGMSGAGVQQDRRLSKPPWCTGTQRLGEAQRHSSMGGLSDPRCCMGPSEPTSTAGQGSCGRLEEGGALQGAAQLERKRKAAERHRG